ncbi:MAG: MlaD family protein [Sphingobacteriales bacterium]|nr:MlaD family protein [Sphingobacteriales bacterium]
MKINNETKVGIITVFAVTILILGYNYLKGKDIFTDTVDIYAEYSQINGIKESNPILYNGFVVGKITKLSLSSRGTIIARLTIKPELQIPDNTIAKIVSQDLLGAKAIELFLGDSRTFIEEGDTIRTDMEMSLAESVNSQVLPIKQKAEQLLGTVDSILVSVQYILNPNFRMNIDESFASIKRSIETLEITSTRVDSMVKFQAARFKVITNNIESISTNLRNNNEKITNILQNIDQISDSLTKVNFVETIDRANKALSDIAIITEKINTGQGTLGMLVNDEMLYKNLNQSSKDLDKLLVDLRLNPKRYVSLSLFGGGGKKYKDPDSTSTSSK